MTIGSDANALFTELLEGENIEFPTIDLTEAQYNIPYDADSELYKTVPKLTNEDLVSCVNGDGTFDTVMKVISEHLEKEYKQGRITGSQYSEVYIGAIQAALGNATQFLLGRDAAFWQAQTAQYQALQARMNAITSKFQMVATQYSALREKANYALSKVQAVNLGVEYDTNKYRYDNILPTELELANLNVDITTFQREGADLDNQTKDYALSYTLPTQLKLVTEQTEAQRAQTMDTRMDGVTAIVGSVGKQKDLYNQQIISYQRDAEVKAAKLFTDAWITQKTIDDGLVPPNGFTNASLDTVLTKLKVNNDLD